MTFGVRLEELRGTTSIADFAGVFKIHKNTYSNYVKHQNVPDSNFIAAVCQKFGVSANWLLMGIGPKYLHDHPVSSNAESLRLESKYVLLPLIETWIIDREGELLHDGVLDYVAIKRSWIGQCTSDFSEQRLRSFLLTRVRRNFMSPTINPGDLILVDTDREIRDRPKTGEIYLVRLPDGERAVKRVAVIEVRNGCRILFYSDNVSSYGAVEFDVPAFEDLHRFILGKVGFVFRDLCINIT